MPRFFRPRDVAFIDHINREVVNSLIDSSVVVYKLDLNYTEENLYGEAKGGQKYWMPGVRVKCLISHDDETYDSVEYGVDKFQKVKFAFHRNSLWEVSLYPEVGDIIDWYRAYYEIDTVVENQILGGQDTYVHSIVCYTHMTRIEKLNISEGHR